MKLSDVMSAMDLAGYAEVALVLFMAAFLLVTFDVVRRGRKLEAHAWLPFDSTRAPRRMRPGPLVLSDLDAPEERK